MKTEALFTKQLHSYLKQRGYTHIQNVGCAETGEDDNNDTTDYLLIPLKQENLLRDPDDSDVWIEDINSPEILEMTDGEEGVNFVVELPEDDYEKFNAQNR